MFLFLYWNNSTSIIGFKFVYELKGVRGAYSESAAEKAYPNCEAVPCEQFDTAFEVTELSFVLVLCMMTSMQL